MEGIQGLLPDLEMSLDNNYFRYFSLNNLSGRLINKKIFINKNNSFFIKKSINNNFISQQTGNIYSIVGAQIFPYILVPSGVNIGTSLDNYYVGVISLPTYSSFLESTVSKEYMEDVPVNVIDDSNYKKLVTKTNYNYNNPFHYQLTNQKTIFPDETVNETTYSYAHEKGNQKLLDANMISIPLEITTLKRKDSLDLVGKMTSRLETIYPDQNNYPTSQAGNLMLPLSIKSYDVQSNLPSLEITYDKYDSKGNLLQYTDKGDFTTIIIWGYNQTQPIIKIEGAGLRVKNGTPSDLKILLDQAINESNLDAAAGANNDETPLLSALTNVRNSTWLSDAQVTTYTHDSLIGVTSITPPSGIREIYKYDSANRLENIKDINGKLLKEFKYNYKH